MTSENVKKIIHTLAFIEPAMIHAVGSDEKLWNALYECHKKLEHELRELGIEWDSILHIERLGTAIYYKREQGKITKSMLYWLA